MRETPEHGGADWHEAPIRDAPLEGESLPQETPEEGQGALDPGAGWSEAPFDGAEQSGGGGALSPDAWDPGDAKPRPIPWRALLPAAMAALVLIALGVGVLAVSGRSGHASVGQAHPTATTAPTATATTIGAPTATANPFTVPTAVLQFGVGGSAQNAQQCSGTAPLDPLSFYLSTGGSTVPVDWYVSITDTTPDGKLPWAVAHDPYGTLPAGQSIGLTITPDPSLCTQLATKASQSAQPVTYHATIFYGGVGGVTITDTVTPPTTGKPLPSATP